LFEKIRDRFEDVSLGDDKAKATQDPEKARFFNFDYVVDGANHGNITMSIIDETSLKIYFSKNISSELDDEQKHQWYSFLRELREFARRNLLSFEPRDITRSTLKHRDIQQQSKADSTYAKDEVVAESRMYGSLNRSFESFGPVRIKLQHTKPIMDESHGARSRNIQAIFVENDQGERFRLPFENLTGARAMARHVSAGGVPTDELGRHITEMVNEMTTLRPFVRGMHRRTFEDAVTTEMVESAFGYHALLKNTLKKMKGKKGYTEFKESFKPALVEDEVNVAELKELFVKKTLDERIEQALPLVHKAYTMMKENNNPFSKQFESWANNVAEGAWALPQSEEDQQKLIDILGEELPVGVDAQNATNLLYNIFGDDKLFDRLEELAEIDPNADARDAVMGRLSEINPQMYQTILDAVGDADTPEPAETGSEGGDLDEGIAVKHLSDATAKGILDQTIDIYDILAGHTKVQPGEQELLQTMYDDISSDTGLHGDDDFEDIIERMYDYIEHDYGAAEGNTYGSGDSGMDGQVSEGDWQKDDVEMIQSAIIRRILNNIEQHGELLLKAGPEGVMNAAGDVASFHAPVEELGSSDISAMVREVYNEVGVDYPEEEVTEEKDKISYDPKTGKLTGWEHEGDWKKQTKKKDPVGKIHHMSDVARRRTEKLAQGETLEEAFERLVNEGAINVGDIIRDKTQPEISGKVVGEVEENYTIQVDGEIYHIKKLNAEKVNGLHEDQVADKLQSFVGQTFYVPKEGNRGTVSAVADPNRFSNSLVVDLANGTTTVVHFTDLEAQTPGIVKQTLDKLKSVITGGGTPKMQPKPYGSVPTDMKEDILKLAGIK
jgi:hypothetical protein